MMVHRTGPPEQGERPLHAHIAPPAVVTITVPLDGPVTTFDALVRATNARDFRAATAARKALRRHGWSVAPLTKGGTS